MDFVFVMFPCSLVLLIILIGNGVEGSHFRGGTISWKPTGNGNEVEFKFKLAWTYGHGPGCTAATIGTLVTGMSSSYWNCDKCTPQSISNVNYICTGASQTENWEQGERTFKYTFPGNGPYVISFKGGAWMSLSYGSASNWNVQTVVDLRQRSDTGRPNMSPLTASKPIFVLQSDCTHALKIPMIDADGDNVRCRWSSVAEAASISKVLPNARIDERTCTIYFDATASNSYVPGGWYAVAITVEDYPKTTVTIGGTTFTPSTNMSSIPVQFLINTPKLSGPCTDIPVFVSNTPAEGAVIPIRQLDTLHLRFYADSKNSITSITLTSPAGLTRSGLRSDDLGRPNTKYIDITWTPTPSQKGVNILCGLADDADKKSSDPRCVTLLAWDVDPCESTPCENSGTCTRVGFTDDFTCACVPGFTGTVCETEIDECASSPCLNAGYCLDFINMYECKCDAGYTGINCETDIDECLSLPCQHGGSCKDHVNMFTCDCASGYTGDLCQTEINECLSGPCKNGGSCADMIDSYLCVCRDGFTGLNCEIDIDECVSSPCLQNGTCLDRVNGFTCLCPVGWSGQFCQTGMDHCNSRPCLHNGVCENQWGGFKCHCPDPWHGSICEYKDIIQSKNCKALQYTECDCVMNTRKNHVVPTHHVEAGGYGALFGFLSSIIAYVTWFYCCSTQQPISSRYRVRPITERPNSFGTEKTEQDRPSSQMSNVTTSTSIGSPVIKNIYSIPTPQI